MKNRRFLKSALQKSLNAPDVSGEDRIFSALIDDLGLFYQAAEYAADAEPCFVHPRLLKKLQSAACFDASNAKTFAAEFAQYCHDFGENIVMPDETSAVKKIKKDYNLSCVNRQTAQRRITATRIFPSEYLTNLFAADKIYANIYQRLKESLQKAPATQEIVFMEEFRRTYNESIRCLQPADLLFIANKRLFKKYTHKLLAQVFQNQPIDLNDVLSLPFRGQKLPFLRAYINRYRAHLLQTAACINRLCGKPELIGMAQLLLTDSKRFKRLFRDFYNCRADADTDDLLALNRAFVQIHRRLAIMHYLSASANALENQNLRPQDVKQQPELPAVSPQDELKKIEILLQKGQKDPDPKSKLAQICLRAHRDFSASVNHFEDLWIKFRGLSPR